VVYPHLTTDQCVNTDITSREDALTDIEYHEVVLEGAHRSDLTGNTLSGSSLLRVGNPWAALANSRSIPVPVEHPGEERRSGQPLGGWPFPM